MWERSPGGLVSAMQPVIERHRAIWVGWDGGVGRAGRGVRVGKLGIAPVRLNRAEVDGYYQGFCNSTLWPLYHDAIHQPVFESKWWQPYVDVNARFATAIARRATRNARIWIHDYHLQLVPRLLRQMRPDLRIGFFLHIPFPPDELFAQLPQRAALLEGLLGADLCAFQTSGGAINFSRVARRYTDAEGTDHELTLGEHTVRCIATPISVDADAFEGLANSAAVKRRAAEIRRQLGGRKIILAVDRLDYTKGIAHRLRAIEGLLRSRRLSAEKVVHLQIGVPSREEAHGYEGVRREVEEIVGRINGTFAEPGRPAVQFFRRSLPREELTAYYVAADVMVVTPLRDGMNLVAKEYVASRVDHSGVLVLSEFAGAAREMRMALQLNPRDTETFEATILKALHLPARDVRMRMAVLRTQVRRHTVFDWAEHFLEALER